jgi:hypothetical protein
MQRLVIKGWDKWDDAQAAQHEPFIFIQSNGSKWAGDEEDDIPELLDVLSKYALNFDMFDGEFYSADPCHGVSNPKYCMWEGRDQKEPAYIDGPRMYQCDGVYRFHGNFLELSHVFSIDTNDKETIASLVQAIDANKARWMK